MIRQLLLSFYWLAYNLQWAALLAIVIPSQVAALVGPHHKELATGIVAGAGALFSLVLTPVAGALSIARARGSGAAARSSRGHRGEHHLPDRDGRIGPGPDWWRSRSRTWASSSASNWAGRIPYAALIPDVVPVAGRGPRADRMALMSTIGTLAGVLVAGQLVQPGRYLPAAAVIAAVLVIATVATCAGVRETPRRGRRHAGSRVRIVAASLLPDPRAHRDFYWVLVTRCLVGMGIYSVFSFFQYFLADVIGERGPNSRRVPDRNHHRGRAVDHVWWPARTRTGSGESRSCTRAAQLMALASLAFVFAGYGRSLPSMFTIGAVFGIGYGAYQAVDWALADRRAAARRRRGPDMGIWRVALVLPQVLAPALSGLLLAAFKPVAPGSATRSCSRSPRRGSCSGPCSYPGSAACGDRRNPARRETSLRFRTAPLSALSHSQRRLHISRSGPMRLCDPRFAALLSVCALTAVSGEASAVNSSPTTELRVHHELPPVFGQNLSAFPWDAPTTGTSDVYNVRVTGWPPFRCPTCRSTRRDSRMRGPGSDMPGSFRTARRPLTAVRQRPAHRAAAAGHLPGDLLREPQDTTAWALDRLGAYLSTGPDRLHQQLRAAPVSRPRSRARPTCSSPTR